MHIGIVGPIDTASIANLVDGNVAGLPRGYSGAPLVGTLIAELLARGHQVSAFTLSSDMTLGDNRTVVASHGRFSLEYCPMRPRAWGPNGKQRGRIIDLYRLERKVMGQAIRTAAPDVIHAHWTYEFALAAIDSGIPHVITCHDSPIAIARINTRSKPTISGYRWLRVLMAREALRRATNVTAVSPYIASAVQKMTGAAVTVVANPVDDLAVSLFRARSAPATARLAMVCNGWNAGKNQQPALLAFAQFRAGFPAAELHLYGHGFGPGEAGQQWCVSRNIEAGMHFLGAISHARLLKAIAGLDLLIHPSIEESFGMVIAEAMVMGVPVVAGNRSGAVPWVLGDAGALCDIRDPDAIAHAIRSLLLPAAYERASLVGGEHGKQRFAAYHIADQYVARYDVAIGNRMGK